MPAREHYLLGLKKGFAKGEKTKQIRRAPHLIKNVQSLKIRQKKGKRRPDEILGKYMSGVVCSNREGSLKKQRKQHAEENIAFCNAIYHPALSNRKKMLMGKWHLI